MALAASACGISTKPKPGAYVALTLMVEARAMGWDVHLAFWIALPLTMVIMGGFGYLLDRTVLREQIAHLGFGRRERQVSNIDLHDSDSHF